MVILKQWFVADTLGYNCRLFLARERLTSKLRRDGR